MIAALIGLCLFVANAPFEQGNALYLAGDFEGALVSYEKADPSGAVLYNKGNCLFRLGRYGEALRYYLEARSLLHRNASVEKNILVTRDRLGFEKPSDFGFVQSLLDRLKAFHPREYLTAAAFLLCPALLFFAYFLARGGRAGKRLAYAWAGLAGIHFILAVAVASGFETRWGVAVHPCEVHSEPTLSAGDVRYTLREGEEVRVEEERGEWLHVQDKEDRKGWVRLGEVFPLR